MKKIKFIILLAMLAIIGFECSIKEPQMPQWLVPVNVPLDKYSFTMEDLLQDSTIFQVNPQDSSVEINISGEISKQTITQQDLTISQFDSSTIFQLDTVVIDSFDVIVPPAQETSLGNLFPDLRNFVGQKIIIPSQNISGYQISVPTGEFNTVHAYSGKIRLTVKNNLPVAIAANSTLTLYSAASQYTTDSTLFVFTLPNDLAPGQSIVLPVGSGQFYDKWLVSPVYYSFDITSLQSQDSVFITDSLLTNSNVELGLKLYDIKADIAYAKLYPHEYSWDEKVAVTDSNIIYYGEVESGMLHLEVKNGLPIGGSIRIKFLNIRNGSNSPFAETVFIKPDSMNLIDIDLSGLKVVGLDAQGNIDNSHNTPVDSIWYQVFVTNDSTNGWVQINAKDSIYVHLYTADIVFKRLEGELTTRTITFDPIEENNIADYQSYEGTIQFNNLRLIIQLYNELNIENVNFELHLEAYHKENGVITKTKTISPLLTGTLTPGTPDNPSLNTFTLTGPEIEDLVNILPTDLKVWGSATAGGRVVVEAGQGIYGNYQFISPMEIRIDQPLFVNSNVEVLNQNDISSDIQNKIREHRVQSLMLLANIQNTLPVGGEFLLLFDTTRTQTTLDTTNADLIIRLDQFLPASVGADGVVSDPLQIQQSIELTDEQIQLFANPPIQWKYVLKINPTDTTVNNGYVKFLSSNGADIEGTLEFNFKVDKDL